MNIDLEFLFKGNRVGESHFGANYLANRQAFGQTIEEENLYSAAAAATGVSRFRYPGGTIAEKFFDISDSRHFDLESDDVLLVSNYFDQSEQVTFSRLSSFLRFADAEGGKVTIVLPTIRYFDDLISGDATRIASVEATLKTFVTSALTSPYGRSIEAFEIGNEFPSWVAGHNVPILRDSVDFAMITRNFSVWIDDAIQSSELDHSPGILAQAAFVLYGPRGNKALLEGIFDDASMARYSHVEGLAQAYHAIDGVTVHSYPLTPWSTDNLGLESLERDIELFDRWQTAFDKYAADSGLERRDLTRAVTEWNTRNLAMNNGLVEGIQAATGTMASFFHLVRNGVDMMHVWPVLQNSTSALVDSSGRQLSANFNGAAFSILEKNVSGLRAHQGQTHFDVNNDGQTDVLVQLYSSQHRTVLAVASVSDSELNFTLNLPLQHFNFSNAAWTSFSLLSTNEDATDLFGSPAIYSNIDRVDVSLPNNSARYSLEPWEVNFTAFSSNSKAMIDGFRSVEREAIPLTFTTETFDSIPDAELLERLNQGALKLVSTTDSDTIWAVPGFTINTLEGDDYILDTPFSETIVSGEGNDTIVAGSGSAGDVVHGGYGRDEIIFGSAPSLLLGGPDDDVFLFRPSAVHQSNTFAVNASNRIQTGTLDWLPVAGFNRNESIIDGGEGYDILFLSDGDDALFMDDDVSSHFSGAGNLYRSTQRLISIEEIHAGAGNDLIDLTSSYVSESVSGIKLFGGEGNDTIWSNEGDDFLYGGAGDDILFAGAGINQLYGGSGADTFVFTWSSTQTSIHDFSSGEGDVLRFVDGGGAVFDQQSVRIIDDHVSILGIDPDGNHFTLNISLFDNELSYA